MGIFKSHTLETYLKRIADPVGKRQYLRLPVTIPILYGFPDSKKKIDFRQSHTLDVSVGGIGVEILDPSEAITKIIKNKNQKVIVHIDLPQKESFIEFTGIIKWVRESSGKGKHKLIVGIQYAEINDDDKINIMSYAMRVIRKKKMIKVSLVGLAVLLAATTLWGGHTMLTKKVVEHKLEVSETTRVKLQKDIQEMLELKKNLLREMQDFRDQIKSQQKIMDEKEKKLKAIEKKMQKAMGSLKKQQEELVKSKSELAKSLQSLDKIKAKMQQNKIFIAGLEEKIYYYVVKVNEEMKFYIPGIDTSIFNNQNYISAGKAMKNGNFSEAVALYLKAVTEKPGSPWAYSGLARAYYRVNNYDKAKNAFRKYLDLHQKYIKVK